MDIYRVRYFHVFANTGSLIKASEILHISQPALSKALRQLETEIGSQLLRTEGRNLKLTNEGKKFLELTAPLLNQWLNLKNKLHDKSGSSDTIRIASFEVFTTHFLGQLNKYIDLKNLELHEHRPGHMERAILDGRADIGITYAPIPLAGLDFTEVTRIEMGVYGAKKLIDVNFFELPFVIPLLPTEGTPSKVQGLDGWPDHKIARKITHRVTMMESALELCRQGLCVAYLPQFVVHLHNKKIQPDFHLQEIASPIPSRMRKQSVFLIQRQGTKESKNFRSIAKALRALEYEKS